MQVLQELGLAYTMLSGAFAHVLIAFHLIQRNKAVKALEAKMAEFKVGK